MLEAERDEEWQRRIAVRPSDFAALEKSCEDFLGKLPKKLLTKLVEKEEDRQKRGSFGTFQGMKNKPEHWATEWQGNGKKLPPTSLDSEEDLVDDKAI